MNELYVARKWNEVVKNDDVMKPSITCSWLQGSWSVYENSRANAGPLSEVSRDSHTRTSPF